MQKDSSAKTTRPTRLTHAPDTALRIQFEGRDIPASATDSVAAALIGAGIQSFRTTTVRSVARGPFCLMGVCFDCLVEIDGIPNQQACMVPVRPDMKIRRMHGARTASIANPYSAQVDETKT